LSLKDVDVQAVNVVIVHDVNVFGSL